MISTNNKSTWKKCWSLKDHGKNYHSVFYKKHKEGFRWLHDYHGSNYRMTEMQSALGRYQLKNLDEYIKKRNKIAYLYLDGLQDFWNKYKILKKPNYTCSDCPIKKNCDLCKHAFYRLDLFVNKKVINQIKFIEQLNKNDISCLVGSCPEIYREKIFKKLYFYPKKRLSNAKLLGETSVMFRINPNKSLSLIKREINVIKKILNSYTKS
jgi:dTDP-4-amino-4,6-dideoxygalactose transaminase